MTNHGYGISDVQGIQWALFITPNCDGESEEVANRIWYGPIYKPDLPGDSLQTSAD